LAELSIPKSNRLGLAILREMPDDVLKALLIAIEKSPSSVPVIPDVSSQDAEQVKDALDTMYAIRAYNEVSLEEFISDVCEALRENDELKPQEEPQFRERLTKLLDIEALSIAAKALALQTEHEHLFCSARILTDARPVYGKSVSESPAAMIITHMLKLSYHEGGAGRLNEFYIGLGSNDIAELRSVLDRADEKEKSLRATFDSSKIRFIDPQQ